MEELFHVRIRRRGGACKVTLPGPLVESLGLRDGDCLRWTALDGALALHRVNPRDGDGAPGAPQGG